MSGYARITLLAMFFFGVRMSMSSLSALNVFWILKYSSLMWCETFSTQSIAAGKFNGIISEIDQQIVSLC